MIQIMSSGGEVSYGVNDYVIDTDDELNEIPNNAEAGSTAYSIESGTTFIKNNMNEWSVLNTSNGPGGGGAIELPDNILYSYEMTEEEFWDNYNNSNLVDGLYAVDINQAIVPTNIAYNFELDSEAIVKDDYCWMLSYDDTSLLKINEQGEIVQHIEINKDFQFASDGSSSAIIIDDNGYLYLGGMYKQVVSINTNNLEEQNHIIPNELIDDSTIYWNFRFIQNYVDSVDFKVLDGGTFAINSSPYSYSQHEVAYFKNGQLQSLLDLNAPRKLQCRYECPLTTVDYNQNKLYYVNFDNNQETGLGLLKLCSVNTNGTYNNYTLTNQFELPHSSEEEFKYDIKSTQMFIRNDILYIQLVINTTLYCFLFDTITNQTIQEEQINAFHENETYWYIERSIFNDIYHSENFSVSRITYGGSYGTQPVFLKINYQNELSYIELLTLNIINVKQESANSANGYQDIFINRCNEKGQYLYIDGYTKQIHLFSLFDGLDTVVGDSKIYNSINIYANFPNENDFFITSYDFSSYIIGCVRIDSQTGNILDSTTEKPLGSSINSSVRDSFPQIGKVFFGNDVIDAYRLKIDYDVQHLSDYSYPLIKIKERQFYLNSNNRKQLGYYDTNGELTLSYLVHKNNIILKNQIQEN